MQSFVSVIVSPLLHVFQKTTDNFGDENRAIIHFGLRLSAQDESDDMGAHEEGCDDGRSVTGAWFEICTAVAGSFGSNAFDLPS
jgi:hypothetical protein